LAQFVDFQPEHAEAIRQGLGGKNRLLVRFT
jgi:hypothetical protein